MPINSIISQPAANTIRSAYVPALIVARGNNFASDNPVVYFDVYINGAYYKTITTTVSASAFFYRYWTVDVKDAVQEYLRSPVPQPLAFGGGSNYAVQDTASVAQVQVKVRGSSYGTGGVIIPDGPVPVQGTVLSLPVAGGGTATLTWAFVNAALQHEERQELNQYLGNIPRYQEPSGTTFLYPLSPRQRIDLTPQDWGFWPVMADYSPYIGDPTGSLRLRVITSAGAAYDPSPGTFMTFTELGVYYLPIGPRNLASYAWQVPGVGAVTDQQFVRNFYTADWYQVALVITGTLEVLYKTPRIYLKRCRSYKRVHFMNWLGHFEALNFGDFEETVHVASATAERSLTTPPVTGSKGMFGTTRYNVRSNEETALYGVLSEEQVQAVKELLTSPVAYLEYSNADQGVPTADYLPIVVQDDSLVIRKLSERYAYEVTVRYLMANPNIHVRN